jgi:RimJ/RimL family protein N-acetyltransferase
VGRNLTIKAPCWEDIDTVRHWRNLSLSSYRTPYPLNEDMQKEFYQNVICNRDKNSRWWSVYLNETFIGLIGVENIEWENSLGELYFTISPDYLSYGIDVFRLLLEEGFHGLGLEALYKECYECDTNLAFWYEISAWFNPNCVELIHRKRYKGKVYNSIHMTFTKAGMK